MAALEFKTLRENVVDAIRKKIINQELKQGVRIKEMDLAAEFQTSRGPIREALRQLENEGLIEYVRNVGCSVRTVTAEESYELFLLRANYEILAVKILEGKIPEETLGRITEVVEKMRTLPMEAFDSIFELDHEFHQALIDMTGMPYLYRAWTGLDYGVIVTSFGLTVDRESALARQYVIHNELLEVLREGDVEKISTTLVDHYMSTVKRVMSEQGLAEEEINIKCEFLI